MSSLSNALLTFGSAALLVHMYCSGQLSEAQRKAHKVYYARLHYPLARVSPGVKLCGATQL